MDALMVKLHLEENGFQMVFEGVEAIEDAVMEGLLTSSSQRCSTGLSSGAYGGSLSKRKLGASERDSL